MNYIENKKRFDELNTFLSNFGDVVVASTIHWKVGCGVGIMNDDDTLMIILGNGFDPKIDNVNEKNISLKVNEILKYLSENFSEFMFVNKIVTGDNMFVYVASKKQKNNKKVCKKSVILIGKPTSGKGTQSEILKSNGYKHIGTGDILRRHKKEKTEIGLKAIEVDKIGGLMSDEDIENIILEEVSKDVSKPFVFDGSCRTIKQFKFLESMLNDLGIEFVVINIEIVNDEVFKRSRERFHKTKERAEDNNYNIIQYRIDNFYKNTLPILSITPNITINGNMSVGEISNLILSQC